MTVSAKKTALLVILGLAVFFSLYKLTESPVVWYDEGFYVQTASNLANHGIAGMELAPGVITPIAHLTVGYPVIYPLAAVFKLWGTNILAARLLIVPYLVGLVIVGFFLIRSQFGTKAALLSAGLLATFPPLYGNGKSVLGEVPGLFWLTLFLFTLDRSLASTGRSRVWYLIGSGISGGLCAVTKPIYLILLPAACIAVFVARKQLKMSEIALGVAAFLAPIVIWLFIQFEPGDSAGFILNFYSNPYQYESLLAKFITNFKFFLSGVGPIYFLGMLIVWMMSVIVRLRRRVRIRASEVAALSFTVINFIAYFRTAGWYRYIFPAQVLALIYFPSSLTDLAGYAGEKVSRLITLKYAVVVTILLCLLGIYQIMFNSWVANGYKSDRTAFWQDYFQKETSDMRFYYNTPELALFDTRGGFYQYLQPAGGDIGKASLEAISKRIPDAIFMETDAWESLKKTEEFAGYNEAETHYRYTVLRKTN